MIFKENCLQQAKSCDSVIVYVNLVDSQQFIQQIYGFENNEVKPALSND